MYRIPTSPNGLLRYAFRALGKKQVPFDKLWLFLSFELRQMEPSKARKMLKELASHGVLVIDNGMVSLSPQMTEKVESKAPTAVSNKDFGVLIRQFVSSSRLSRAFGIKDNAMEITRRSDSPLLIEVLVHGTKDYQLVLDEAAKMITHNCPDWRRVSVIRRFCKHVAKLFLLLEKDEALRLLLSMQNESWRFEEI